MLEKIVPKLLEAARSDDTTVRYQAVIALGKAGDPRVVTTVAAAIGDSRECVREAAVYSLAILGAPIAGPMFRSLLENDKRASNYLNGHPNTSAVRGAAALGLGMLGDGSGKTADLLAKHARMRQHDHHIPLLAAVGLGLLTGDAQYVEKVATALREIVEDKRGHGWARGQALVALGRLHARNGVAPSTATRELMLAQLKRKKSAILRRSAALAVGYLPADAATLKALRHTLDRAKDAVTRNFAAVSLGRIGGDGTVKALVSGVTGGRAQSRAYCALALGIRCHSSNDERDRAEALRALRRGFDKTKDPATRGAFALALGIARDHESGPSIAKVLGKGGSPTLRGDCAVALGMIGYRRAMEELTEALHESRHDPLFRERVAIGLGLLGSREAVGPLLASLRGGATVSTLNATTAALGLVGDRDAIEPVIALLDDRRSLTRTFACAALGTIGDPRDLPALSVVRTSHNYFSCCGDFNEALLAIDR